MTYPFLSRELPPLELSESTCSAIRNNEDILSNIRVTPNQSKGTRTCTEIIAAIVKTSSPQLNSLLANSYTPLLAISRTGQ